MSPVQVRIDRIEVCSTESPDRVRAVVTGALERLALRIGQRGELRLKLRSVVLEEADLRGEDAAERLAGRLERWLVWEGA